MTHQKTRHTKRGHHHLATAPFVYRQLLAGFCLPGFWLYGFCVPASSGLCFLASSGLWRFDFRRLIQRLFEIGKDIITMLDPHRQPHIAGCHPGCGLFLG